MQTDDSRNSKKVEIKSYNSIFNVNTTLSYIPYSIISIYILYMLSKFPPSDLWATILVSYKQKEAISFETNFEFKI